jgi:hypothetical protein
MRAAIKIDQEKMEAQMDVNQKKGETDHRQHKHIRQKRRKGGTPVGYSGRTALRREKCSV